MYHPEEVAAFRALLAELTDVWRLQNPDATDCYTVWDEKTAARDINKVLLHGFRRWHSHHCADLVCVEGVNFGTLAFTDGSVFFVPCPSKLGPLW